MVEWLGMSSDLGNPKMKDDLIKAASGIQKLCKSSDNPLFKNGLLTKYWVESFLKSFSYT